MISAISFLTLGQLNNEYKMWKKGFIIIYFLQISSFWFISDYSLFILFTHQNIILYVVYNLKIIPAYVQYNFIVP